MKKIQCHKCRTSIEVADSEQRIAFCDKCYAEIFGADAREFDALQREIAKRETWIDNVDERDSDPFHTEKEAKAEAEKYSRYTSELRDLREKQSKLNVKGFE